MNYFSASVDIMTYPAQFQKLLVEERPSVSAQLAALLGVLPLSLSITAVDELVAEGTGTSAPSGLTEITVPPTGTPTISPAPTMKPSISPAPTISSKPTATVSKAPTGVPSGAPSPYPSAVPTFGENITASENYQLEFTLQGEDEIGYLNETDEDLFCYYMANQTVNFAPDTAEYVTTTCIFLDAIVKKTEVVRRQLYSHDEQQQWRESDNGIDASVADRRWWMPGWWMRRINSIYRTYDGDDKTVDTSALRRQRNAYDNDNEEEERRLQVPMIQTYTYFFRMVWVSDVINATSEGYASLFPQYFASNAGPFLPLLADALNVTADNNLTLKGISTFELNSGAPSAPPSNTPSSFPTVSFTDIPTFSPSAAPTMQSEVPTIAPSVEPTPPPSPSMADDTVIIVVVAVVALFAAVVLMGLVWFYKVRQSKRMNMGSVGGTSRRGDGSVPGNVAAASVDTGGMMLGYNQGNNGVGPVGPAGYNPSSMTYQYDSSMPLNDNSNNLGGNRMYTSPGGIGTGSMLSNPSLLSDGQDDDDDLDNNDSDDDLDPLQRHSKLSSIDDFDQFKDQNLERMRAGVVNTVKNMDGMMSQALTMSLVGGSLETCSELWAGAQSEIEIEVNALCEVNDWLKRNDEAGLDEK